MSETAFNPSRTVPISVYVMLFLGLGAMAASSILVKLAQAEGLPSLLVAASRLFVAALLLTPIVVSKYMPDIGRLSRREFALAFTAGAFLALHFASWVTSLEYTSVLISVVFVTSSPLWVALLEFIFLKARLPKPVLIGLGIAIIGGLLIGFGGSVGTETEGLTINGQRELIGGGLSLVGAVAIAVYLIIARNLQQPRKPGEITHKLPIIPYIWLVYGSAGLMLMIWVLFARIPLTGYSAQGYLWVLAMAIFPQLVGHSSLNYAVGYLSATIVSMVTQLEPIGSAIIAYFLFGELPLPLQILGSVTIIIGVMLANFGQSRKRRQTS